MPNVTPVWGLTYPCPGEVVTAASFAQLNTDIEEALSALDAKSVAAKHRPALRFFRSSPIITPNNGTGFITASGPTDYDVSINWPIPGGAPITPVKGLYELTFSMGAPVAPLVTMTSESLYFGFTTYLPNPGRRWRIQGGPAISDVRKSITIVVPLNAGEAINLAYNPAGTAGNVTTNQAHFAGRLIVPLP